MKNEIIVSFGIWDFEDITHNELSKIIGIEPQYKHIKGEIINPNFGLIAKKNGWIMTSPFETDISFKIKMNWMLDFISSKMEVFKTLSNKYYCEFSCGLYIYTDTNQNTPSVHLGKKYYEITKDLKIEFDVDIILLAEDD